jgi:hypothetical protein
MKIQNTTAFPKIFVKVLVGMLLGAGVTFAILHSDKDNVPTRYASVLKPDGPPSSVVWTNLNRFPEYFRERRNAVRQVERSEAKGFHDAWMWTAKNPNEWGEVVYELPVETNGEVKYATLSTPINVHVLVDPLSRAEIWLRSSSRPEWERVVHLHSNTEFQLVPMEMDVTSWLQNADALEVKFRLLGSRILAHPDPDSLIGPAGAQAMRCTVGDEAKSLVLNLWAEESTD